MDVKPYNPSEGKKQQVSKMFDRIAPSYDFLNHFLSLGIDRNWRRRVIKILKTANPEKILDVATGTGDVALLAAKEIKNAHITGIDISPMMLEIGRKKISKQQLNDRMVFIDGDSENMPFADNIFDAVTVAYGVRNFENLNLGLKEILRVLKKDGKLIVLEFSRPKVFPFKQIYNLYFKHILPFIGKVTSKDQRAYQYLFESVQAFPDGEDFLNILNHTGFKNNQWIPLTLGVCSIYTAVK